MVEFRERRPEEIRMAVNRSSNQFQWADGVPICRPVDRAARSFCVSRQSVLGQEALATRILQFTTQRRGVVE